MAQPLEKGLKMGLKVLIALAGMSPAVVTETLWALSHQGLPTGKRFAPDRLVLVTEVRHQAADFDEFRASVPMKSTT